MVDEQLRDFGRVLACGGFFGLLGFAFGGLAGHVAWKGGRPAGSAAGLAVANAVARVTRRQATPAWTGTLVGAVDGLFFLGLLGTMTGLCAVRVRVDWAVAGRVAGGALLLAGGALFFGWLAIGMIYGGARAFAGVFAGGVVGAASGAALGRTDGLLIGAVGGVLAGTLLGVVNRGKR